MSAPRYAGRTLAAVHRRWGALNEAQGTWLVRQGVPPGCLLSPTPVGAARAQFNVDGTFAVDGTGRGTGALTFRIQNVDGADIDIAAWSPTSGELGTWYGRGFALGEDQILNPASYFAGDALRVHADPWAWLRSGRDGICIIRPELTYAMLRNAHRVSFADFDFAKQFETWIKPPAPRVQMFIEEQEEGIAS